MKHIKTFENYSGNLNEGIFDKVKTAFSGGVPKIEKLVEELKKDLEKGDESFKSKYESCKKDLNRFKNVFSKIEKIKVPKTDDKYVPFTEENYLALANYYDFGVKAGYTEKAPKILIMTQKVGKKIDNL